MLPTEVPHGARRNPVEPPITTASRLTWWCCCSYMGSQSSSHVEVASQHRPCQGDITQADDVRLPHILQQAQMCHPRKQALSSSNERSPHPVRSQQIYEGWLGIASCSRRRAVPSLKASFHPVWSPRHAYHAQFTANKRLFCLKTMHRRSGQTQ